MKDRLQDLIDHVNKEMTKAKQRVSDLEDYYRTLKWLQEKEQADEKDPQENKDN